MHIFCNNRVSRNALKSVFCLTLSLSPTFLIATYSQGASAQNCILNGHEFAYVADQDATKVSGFLLNPANGQLSAVPGSPFATGKSGSTSVAVDPAGRFLYVTNPFPGDNNVVAFSIDCASGRLVRLPGSPFAAGEQPSSIAIVPSGKFAYVANAGSDTVSAYKIDEASGRLISVSNSSYPTGTAPSSIVVDPLGKFVYVTNKNSNNVSAFTINTTTGALTAVSGSPFSAGQSPVSVTVDPNERFVYVANEGSSNVSGYLLNSTNGVLTAIYGSPFAAGSGGVSSVTFDATGNFVYAAGNGGVFSYSINLNSEDFSGPGIPPPYLYGQLTLVQGSPFGGGSPNFVATDYSGNYLYAANKSSNGISAFLIASGMLTPITGSPFSGVSGPVSMALVRPPTFPVFTATAIPAALQGFGSVKSINASGINDKGGVSGTVAFYPVPSDVFQVAFLYSAGTFTGVAFPRVSSGYGINDSGEVVGQQDTQPPGPFQAPQQAFLWNTKTTINIDNVAGRQSAAFGINNAGQVTGSLSTATCVPPFQVPPTCSLGSTHAFIYNGSGLVDIGTLGGTFSVGTSINNLGEVAGISTVASGTATHLFLYAQGHMQDLGASPAGSVGNAVINDRGDILTGPYLYRRGGFQKLPFNGISLNNLGEIVGTNNVPGGSHAFVYLGGLLVDLNKLVDPSLTLLTSATGVSNNSKIVAKGLNGQLYVLTPK
jgi:probable HAF family extracellular repeat protein